METITKQEANEISTATSGNESTVTVPDINKTSVCLVLEMQFLGNSRKIKNDQINVDADESMVRASKKLFDCDELAAVKSLDGEIRKYLYQKCLPSMFKEGIYRVPISSLEKVIDQLEEFKAERQARIEKFLENYEQHVQDAQKKLRNVFDPRNYPTDANDARNRFSMTWKMVTFDTPSTLKAVSESIWRDERNKARIELQQATMEVREVLRQGMAELVNHMYDRLTKVDDVTGKGVTFKAATVSNFQRFLDDFSERNITNDTELASLVDRARKLLGNEVTPDALRKNANVRQTVTEGIGSLKIALDSLMQEQPIRTIVMTDEVV